MDMHAHALVEPDGAGHVLGVDAQADARRPSLAEVAERMPQQRLAEPAAAPGRQYAERTDPPEPRVAGEVPGVQGVPGQLVSLLGEPPERRVVAGTAGVECVPLLEREGLEVPVAREGDVVGLVDTPLFAAPERAHGNSLRPYRFGQVAVELDPHLERVAQRAPAGLAENPGQDRVGALGHHPQNAASDALLGGGQQRASRFRVERADVELVHALADPNEPIEVAAEPPVPLGGEDPDPGKAEPVADLGLTHVALPEHLLGVTVDQPGDLGRLLLSGGPDLDGHASSSSVSGSRERSASSRVGSGSAVSPSLLIQTVDSPSAVAGATSWKRLAATWTSGGLPISRSKACQWPSAGLYEPISEATIASSNGTPICCCEASMKSRSVLERIASFQPDPRASRSASGTSGNGCHPGSERARPSSSSEGAPSCFIASVRTSR